MKELVQMVRQSNLGNEISYRIGSLNARYESAKKLLKWGGIITASSFVPGIYFIKTGADEAAAVVGEIADIIGLGSMAAGLVLRPRQRELNAVYAETKGEKL